MMQWSKMTDDERLVAIFQLVLPFMALFVVQFICLVVLTFILWEIRDNDRLPCGAKE